VIQFFSGSVNDILDELNGEDEIRDSRDLDHLELEDLTIPDVIKLPNKNNNNSSNNNKDFNNRNINNNNNNNNANGNGYSKDEENTTKSTKGSNIISNVKVRGFSYLNGGSGDTSQQQNFGRQSSSGSNGLVKSNSSGGGGSTGKLGDFIRRQQQQDNERPDTSGNSLMSEFMNVRDTKFTSLSPANKQRFLLRKWW